MTGSARRTTTQKRGEQTGAASGRQSRLPISAVRRVLTGAGKTVQQVAEKLNITDRDVRLSIDALRRQEGYDKVARVAPSTFAIKRG